MKLILQPVVAPTSHVVGLALMFLAPGMLIAAIIELTESGATDHSALFLSAGVSFLTGFLVYSKTRTGSDIHVTSVFSIVAWTWIFCSIFGALPFLFGSMFGWGQWDSALFESISGFSCTGSTLLDDIGAHGRGILMWRQMTQWYGGMGMVLLAVTVLPYLGVGGLALMRAEAPGDSAERLSPRVSDTAKRLWLVYSGLTLAIALGLWAVPGPDLYEAFAHALSTAATGGFSTSSRSIGQFNSVGVELVLIAGMIIAGISFALHYRVLTGQRQVYRRSADTVAYLGMICGAIAIFTILNWGQGLASFTVAFRDSAFTAVALGTSTGFGNIRSGDSIGDFAVWGGAAQILILLLMLVGGCVGSTSGGLKTYRAVISVKHLRREIRKLWHPQGVFPVKLGRKSVPEDVVASAFSFFVLFVSFVLFGSLLIASTGVDFLTATSAAVSAMSNMGPALGEAGPTANFTFFTRPARMVLAGLMIVGRLEIYAALLMFASVTSRLRSVQRGKAREGLKSIS